MNFKDKDAKTRMSLYSTNDAAFFRAFDSSGKAKVIFGLDANGTRNKLDELTVTKLLFVGDNAVGGGRFIRIGIDKVRRMLFNSLQR